MLTENDSLLSWRLMNHTFIAKILVTFLSILTQLNLCAQECEQPRSTSCCNDYVYYNTEESRCMGSSRVAVIVGSAIVAGGAIGAVVVSLSGKHHKGSQSAEYSEVSNELSGPRIHDHDHYYSDYSEFSEFNNDSSYSHNDSDPNIVVEISNGRARCKPVTFDIEVEAEDSMTIAPYVEGPEGVVFEGEPQVITSRTALPTIALSHAVEGSYHVGIKTLTPTVKTPNIRVKAIEEHQVTELDASAIYIVD
jgi:hypothetical protein